MIVFVTTMPNPGPAARTPVIQGCSVNREATTGTTARTGTKQKFTRTVTTRTPQKAVARVTADAAGSLGVPRSSGAASASSGVTGSHPHGIGCEGSA
jgi:hypothetical protein